MGAFASPPLLVVRAILGRCILCALPQLNNHTLPISVPSFWSDPGTEESDWGWQALSSSSAPWAKSCSCHHCLSCQTALEGLAVLKSISVAWNKWKSFFQVLPHPWMPCPALLLPAGPLEFPFQFSSHLIPEVGRSLCSLRSTHGSLPSAQALVTFYPRLLKVLFFLDIFPTLCFH